MRRPTLKEEHDTTGVRIESEGSELPITGVPPIDVPANLIAAMVTTNPKTQRRRAEHQRDRRAEDKHALPQVNSPLENS